MNKGILASPWLALCTALAIGFVIVALSMPTSAEAKGESGSKLCGHKHKVHHGKDRGKPGWDHRHIKHHKHGCKHLPDKGTPQAGTPERDSDRPNIVFVATNDQDAASLEQMPYAGGAFQASATTYADHTFAYPLCCPTRVTWLLGQYPHNHGIWANTAEEQGGYSRFKALGYDRANLATRIKGAGYATGMFGFYVNQSDYTPQEPGWDKFLGPSRAYDGTSTPIANDGTRDERISDNAVRFAREEAGGSKPTFQMVMYYAPHHPHEYEGRFADRCQDAGLPPSPAIHEDTDEELADKPAFVRQLAASNAAFDDAAIAKDYRDRCRATLTADEGLKRLVDEYARQGELSETYFIFGTDNGYLLGQHGLRYKQMPYLESAKFPLIVRGPGVDAGATSNANVSSVDVFPTILDIANAPVPSVADGKTMLPLWRGEVSEGAPEFRDANYIEGKRIPGAPDYEGLIDDEYTYTEWAGETGEREYYDLKQDPYQMENSYASLTEERKEALAAETARMRSCKGEACR